MRRDLKGRAAALAWVDRIAGGARRSHGFTLIEILIAILILTLVVTASLALAGFDHQRRAGVAQSAAAWWAIEREIETLRLHPFTSLEPGTRPFLTYPVFSEPMTAPIGRLQIAKGPLEGMKVVTASLAWGPADKRRRIEETVWLSPVVTP